MNRETIEHLISKYQISDEVLLEFYNYKSYNCFYPQWMELRILISQFVRKYLQRHATKIKKVIEIGSDPSIPLADYKEYLPATVEYNSTNIDSEVNVKGSILDIEKNVLSGCEAYDCVICTEVIEHVEYPEKAIFNIRKLLKPGGLLLLTVPVNFRIHGQDYRRLLPLGLKTLLSRYGFEIERMAYEDVMVNEMPLSLRIAAFKKNKPTVLFLGAGMKYDLLKFFLSSFRIITTDTSAYAPSRFICDKSYLTSKFNKKAFVEELKEIIRQEKVNIILPLSHHSLPCLRNNRHELEELNVIICATANETIDIALDKLKLHNHLINHGYQTLSIFQTPEDVDRFPVIIKPILGTSSSGVILVRDGSELKFYTRHMNGKFIQEYIEGPEYTIDAYCNPDGTVVSIVPRIRTEILAGLSIKGKTLKYEALIKYIHNFLDTLRFFGPICIQVIEKSEGEFYIIDVNPRIGAGTSLSVQAGLDIPHYMMSNLNGERCLYENQWTDNLVLSRYFGDIYYEEKSTGN